MSDDHMAMDLGMKKHDLPPLWDGERVGHPIISAHYNIDTDGNVTRTSAPPTAGLIVHHTSQERESTMPDRKTELRQVAWFFRPDAPGAHRPGSFAENLLRTFAAADTMNFARLSASFPAYGDAMNRAMRGTDGGIRGILTEIAPQQETSETNGHQVTTSEMGDVPLAGRTYRGRIVTCTCGYQTKYTTDDGSAEADMSDHIERKTR